MQFMLPNLVAKFKTFYFLISLFYLNWNLDICIFDKIYKFLDVWRVSEEDDILVSKSESLIKSWMNQCQISWEKWKKIT